jgi:hypothetical protein
VFFDKNRNILFLPFACSAILVLASCSGGAGTGGGTLPSSNVSSDANNVSSSRITNAGIETGSSNNAIASPAAAPELAALAQQAASAAVRDPQAVLGTTATTVFQDNFAEQNLNKWVQAAGHWVICRPKSSNYSACGTTGVTSAMFAGSTAGSSYTLQAGILISAIGLKRNGIDLIVRAQDSNHFDEVELVKETDGSQQWEMWRNNGGRWTNLGRGYTMIKTGISYVLRLSAVGSLLTAALSSDNGSTYSTLGTATDSTYSIGQFGLRSWGGIAGSFNNVLVTTTAASAPPSPSPPPTTGGSVAMYRGCPIFTAGDYFNLSVKDAAVDSHSAQYIASIAAAGDTTGFYLSTGIQHLNIADATTPLVKVHPKVSYHTFPNPFAFLSSYKFENSGDSDVEILRVTPPSCHLYEAYNASYSGGVLSAYSGRDDDLSRAMQILPDATPGSSASGLPHFPGMVKWSEVKSGQINHPLYFSAWANSLCNCYTKPASDTDGLVYNGPSTSYQMPYGAHLRLKASFDDSGFGPQAKAIVQALKLYGGFVADTGGRYGNNNSMYSIDDADTPSQWSQSDLGSLSKLRYSDFEVLKVGAITQRG